MTASCESVRSWLPAWIDGERTPLSPEDFERHLAECADCAKLAREQLGFLRSVATAYAPAPVPASLQASIRRKVTWRRVFSQRVAPLVAAGAMAAAIAVGVFTVLRPAPVHAASLAEASAWAHEGLAAGALPLDVAAGSSAELSQWLTERVGFTVVLPKLEDSTIVFNGARVVQLEEGSAAVVSFQRDGERVSLGIAPRHAAGRPANAPHTELFRNMKFTTSTLRGLHVISWSEGSLSYALVSSVPATGRASCAVCHGANSGLKSVEDFHGMR